MQKNDPPAILNTGHPNIQREVDSSCNVILADSCGVHAVECLCEMCLLCDPGLSQQEKLLLANREKDKGNEAFRAKDYEEAVAYYSRSGSTSAIKNLPILQSADK